MASGTYPGFVHFTIFDNDGILPGALLWTYVAGTTTLTPTFTDVGLTTPNTNPVVADAGGRMTVILAPGQAYKFIAQTPGGTEIWTRDNIVGATSATGILGTAGVDLAAGQVVYLADGQAGTTAGRWYLADADVPYASVTPVIGMTAAAVASGEAGTIITGGQVTGLSALIVGGTYYVSQTAGALVFTPPSPNVRVVGVADSATTLVLTGARPSDAVTGIVNTGAAGGPGGYVAALPASAGPGTIICTNTLELIVIGIAPGVDGQTVRFVSKGTAHVTLWHENAGATANSRLLNAVANVNAPTPLAAGKGTATYQYDAVDARWRLVQHEQGAPITPPFVAGDYTGGGAQTWTVDPADVVRCTYYLDGCILDVSLFVNATSVGGTPDTALTRVIPNNFLASPHGSDLGVTLTVDSSVVKQGRWLAASTTISFAPDFLATTNWAAAAHTTAIYGVMRFPVF